MKKIFLIICATILSINFYAQTELWGMTQQGGQFSEGVIFKTDGNGNNLNVVRPFVYNQDGASPSLGRLCRTASGKFYGTTTLGGEYELGVLFEYDYATNTYIKKIDFDTIKGSAPYSSLIQAGSGKLYGMTSSGGANNLGVLFAYDPITNIYIKKIDFDSINGSSPYGSLIEVSSGKLYGMTSWGGANDLGVLFEYDPVTNILIKKIDFTGVANGANPQGDLIQATSGKLYGMTTAGGLNNMGVLFEYDPITSTCINKLDFDGTTTGNFPRSSLLQANNGKLYGATIFGGANNKGVLFEYDLTNDVYSKKIDFAGTINGATPCGRMVQSGPNKLYGLTSSGGVNNKGVLFEYDIATGVLVKKKNFVSGSYGGGTGPISLIDASPGKLLGLTNQGGKYNVGVLFEYDITADSCSTKIAFGGDGYGSGPIGSLMQASNGKLYGMTPGGGIYTTPGGYAGGIIFEYDKNNQVFTKKYDFGKDSSIGIIPYGTLVQVGSDKLYGLTSSGGIHNLGTLFEFDFITGIYATKFNFDSINGRYPYGSLIKSSSGKLYGVTTGGGLNDFGVLFEYDPQTNVYLKKLDFNVALDGYNPTGNLMEASSGKFYGTTSYGGINNKGVIFEYNPLTNGYSKKFDLSVTDGYYIPGNLVQTISGKIYGTAYSGGSNNAGVIFEFDPLTGTYVRKLNFDGVNFGQNPCGGLMQANNGKLYGMTYLGGFNSVGVLFEYDYVNNSYTKKYDFGVLTYGRTPRFTHLLEVCTTLPPTGLANQIFCSGAILSDFNTTGFGLKYYSSATSNTPLSNTTLLTNNTSYYVTQTNGCESDSRLQVLASVNPVPILTVSNDSICVGSSAVLIASGATTYTWSNGVTTFSISDSPITTTIYSVSGTGINSCNTTQTVSVTVDPNCQDVWPGDANSDGIANNLDVLELGLHYTQTGAPRATTGNAWQSYFSNNWAGIITNGKNLNHSDCNGDGTINNDDTLAICNNYGLSHAFKTAQTTTVNPQLSIVPDQASVVGGVWGTASIYLGDATTNINNINGIAYTIDFDNTLIEPNSIYVEYQNSFINLSNQNLDFRKLDFASGKIYTATTHTNNTNVSGFGKIATLHYQIKSTLSVDDTLNLGLALANQSDAFGIITPLTSGSSSVTTVAVGIEELKNSNLISISPNPTKGILNISFATIPQNTKIEMYNGIGALVLSETMNNKNNTINISELSNGLYFIKVLEGNKVVIAKKIVKE